MRASERAIEREDADAAAAAVAAAMKNKKDCFGGACLPPPPLRDVSKATQANLTIRSLALMAQARARREGDTAAQRASTRAFRLTRLTRREN